MSRIELNVVATGNFRNLETSLTRLRTQVNALNAAFVGGRGGAAVLTQVDGYIKGFENAIDASGMFERHMVSITSETTKFGRSLESGTMRMGGLFRAAVEYRRGELGQIRQLAREQIRLQNSTVMRMPDGRAQVIVPRGIDEGIEKQRILNQEYRIFRQVVQNGSTEIINWGKNTQWAGRQLTVGLTVPLTMFGAAAGKMFMDADKQLVRLAKVYGDATKGMVDEQELDSIRKQTLELGQELARTMGIAASETMGIAADIAATGKEGNELLGSTREAIRLSVLGEVDRQEAMRATLSIQNVFKKDTEGLAESINFLNAVENQTSTSLNDLVEGIVKAGPVVQGLGGDMEDLALMMVAMREGGIPAAEAANAIKSSMASLINPTKQTTQLLNGFGIDLIGIVDKNAGDVTGTLKDLQAELDGLNELSRQRAIEQIFGKFQFSRINALLNNIGRAGSQTQQVMAIAGMTTTELAETADRELTAMTESISGKFGRAVETLKANLIPIGEAFVQVGTFLLNVGNKVLEVFNMIPEPIQNVVKGLMFLTALAGPVIMITGVLGNFFGYIVKGISSFMAFKKAGRGIFEVFTPESVAAKSATESLTDSLFDQKVAMGDMAVAVTTLVEKLETLVAQLNEVGGAASNFDKVGAKAEAAATSASAVTGATASGGSSIYGVPSATYAPRTGKTTETTSGGQLVYSHISQNAFIKKSNLIAEETKSKLLGVGTVVDSSMDELNKLLDVWMGDFTVLSDDTVTDFQRRSVIMRAAQQKMQAGGVVDLQRIEEIVSSLSSQELAQFAPTWQQISKQTGSYFGTLASMAQLMQTKSAEVKALFEKYRSEVSILGPEKALENLQSSLNPLLQELGMTVEENIQGIENRIEQIILEVEQLPAAERPVALQERFVQLTAETEARSIEALEGIPGIGRSDVAYQRAMMLGAQQQTGSSQVLKNASEETLALQNELNSSLKESATVQERISRISKDREKIEKEIIDLKKRVKSQIDPYDETYTDDEGKVRYKKNDRALSQASIDKKNRIRTDQAAERAKLQELEAIKESTIQIEQETAQKQELLSQEISVKKEQLQKSYEQDLELIGASEEVVIATKQLAASRKQAAEEAQLTTSAKSSLDAAEAELIRTKKEHARAQQEATRALFRYGSASPQYKEASAKELSLKKRKNAQETEVLALSEKHQAALAQGINTTKRVTKEEAELTLLRERQSQEIIRNTVSTQQNTGANIRNTEVKEQQTDANIANMGVTPTPGGGKSRGLALGGALSVLSMIPMFIPRGEDPNSGLSQTADVLSGVGMGAGMGTMLGSFGGPPGMAIGAAIGGVVGGIAPVMSILSNNAENAAKELEKLKLAAEVANGKLLDLEKSTFDLKPIKDLADLPLDNFQLETEKATSQLYQFTEALKMAEEGSEEYIRVQQFREFENAEDLISSSMFQQMMMNLVQSGAGEETVKTMLAGYLSASGRQDLSNFVNSEIERIFDLGENAQEIGVNYANGLKKVADKALEEAGLTDFQLNVARTSQRRFESARTSEDGTITDIKYGGESVTNAQDLLSRIIAGAAEKGVGVDSVIAALQRGGIEGITSLGFGSELDLGDLSPEAIQEISFALGDLLGAIPNIQDFRTEFENLEVATNAVAQSLEYAITSSDPSAIEDWINSVDSEELQRGSDTLNEFLERLSQTGEGGFAAAQAFRMMTRSGVETSDALKITRMMISDVNTDWRQLAEMSKRNEAQFTIVWNQYMAGAPIGDVAAAGATLSEDIGSRLQGTIDYSGGSGGSGSVDTSEIDDQIEAQDELIEKIKEEREERQKLLNLQKEAMDFALRRQDLENQIARARAEGDFAQAALLQAQLDAAISDERASEVERKRQEEEDRKIKAAEEEKERLQEQKDAMSGGGSGGSGGSSTPSKREQEWTANRINILSSGVVNWTEGAQIRARTLQSGPWSAFFESDKVKTYREELLKLGIPAEEIDAELNDMFESWINNNEELFGQIEEYQFVEDALGDLKLSIESVKDILPEAFSILLDKELSDNEKIDLLTGQFYDLGYEMDESRNKARKLFDEYNQGEFETEGIDQEIQRWIDFNDAINNAQKQLELYQSGKGGPVTADQVERTAQRATGEPPQGQLNAGGVMVTPKEMYDDGLAAGEALPQGAARGIADNTRAVISSARVMANLTSKAAREAWEIGSPSRLFESYGKFLIQGLSDGISSGENNNQIKGSFSSLSEELKNLIVGGFEEVPSDITPSIENAADTFYNIMTTRIQETADKISDILQTSLPGHSFDIVGTPKIYVASGTDSIWSNVLGPSFNSLEITRVPPAFAKGGKVVGPGGPTEDRILAQLSDGEYVVKAAAVKQYGVDFLDTLNAQKYAVGGYVSADRAEREAQNRTISNNTANQVGGYAGQAMRQPYYGSSSNSYSPPTSQPTSSNQRPLSIADRMSMYESSPGVWLRSGINDDPGLPMGSILAAAIARDLRRETAAGLMSLVNDPAGAAQLAGMSQEDYMKYANSSDFWVDLGWFSTNFIPFAAGAKWLGRGINVIRKTKPVRAVSNAYDISKYKIRNNYSNAKKKVGEVGGRVLASAMLGLDRGVGGLGRNVDTLNDVTRSSSRQVLSAEDMTRIDIQSQVKAMRETFRTSRTLPRKPRPIDDMTLARSMSEYMSQQDWDDLVAFANANGMDWESIVANMATNPDAFKTAQDVKNAFLQERRNRVALAQQNDPTYLRLLADNERAAEEFRDSFNKKWEELYGKEDPLFLPKSEPASAAEMFNDEILAPKFPLEVRNGRIARVLSELVGGDMAVLGPIFEKSTNRAIDRLSTQVYPSEPYVFGSRAELLESSYPERIFQHYYGVDPIMILRELAYRNSMGYLDSEMTAVGAIASVRATTASIDPLYKELGEQASLVAAKTLYPDINWTVDTPIQISKVWAGAMPVKDGDFGAILNLPRADRIALNEGAHLTGSGIGTARTRPGLNINDYQGALRRGYTIPGAEKHNRPGEYRTETPITFPGQPMDSHSADELLVELFDTSYANSNPFGPTGFAMHYTPGTGHTYSSMNPHTAGFWSYNTQASTMGMFSDPASGLGGATAARLGIGIDQLNSAQGSVRLGDTFGTLGLGLEQQVLVPPSAIKNLSTIKGPPKSQNTKAIMENRGTVASPVLLDVVQTKSGSRRFRYTATTQSMDRDEYNSLMRILDEYDKYGDTTGGPRFTKDQLLEAVIINETDGRYTISANPHYMNYLGKDFLDRISVIDDVQDYLYPSGGSKTLDQEDIAELTDAFWRSRLERLKSESGMSFDPNDTKPHSMREVVSQEEIDIYNAALDNPLSLGNYSNESVRDAVGIVESIIGKQLYVDTNISSKYRLWKAGSYTPKDIDEVRAFQMIDATENPQIPWLPTVGSFSLGHHRATAPGFRLTAPTSPPSLTKLDVVERISRPKKPSRDTSDDMLMLAQGGLVRLNKSEMSILGKEMTDYASQFVGTPYSPNSFSSQTGPNTGDEGWGCATAMEWLYNNKAGMSLGNKSLSWGQYQTPPGKFIAEGKAKLPGDLLYFYYPNGVNTQNPINHTGMYMGNNTMFHAQNPAAGTNITGIDSDNLYTKGPYAKRILPETIAGMGIPTGRFKMGGKVYGSGGPTADNLLAWLSNGEYVMSADTVKHYGQDFMDALNSMDLSEFSNGGFASKYPGVVAKMDSGGGIRSVFGLKNSSDSISNIEYNINVNVEGTNASPDDIAQAVMKSMKRKERMSGAVTRI